MKKKWAVTAVLPLLCLLTSCGTTKINRNDYLSVTVDGNNQFGRATFKIDGEALLKDNAEAFGLNEQSTVLTAAKIWDDVSSYISGNLDQSTGLSNGDVIHFKWDNPDMSALENSYKVKFVGDDYEMTVSDLEELKEINPFDYLSLSFSGTAPNASVELKNTDDAPVQFNFKASKSSGLKNGDTITVSVVGSSVNSENVEGYYGSQGYLLSATEKQYTVEQLNGYIGKLADLPSDAKDKLDAHAQDLFRAYVAKEWSTPSSLKEVKLLGNYLLTPKEENLYAPAHNQLVFVYQITIADGFSYYYYTKFTDIMLLADGTCSMNLNKSQVPNGSLFLGNPSGTIFEHNNLYYVGYQDLDTLLNDVVTTQIGSYQYETTVS